MVPEKFGSCIKIILKHFHAGTNIRVAQISCGPNFSGGQILQPLFEAVRHRYQNRNLMKSNSFFGLESTKMRPKF